MTPTNTNQSAMISGGAGASTVVGEVSEVSVGMADR